MATAAPENITHPDTRAQWRAWLARHHARSEGVWLVMWKKASGKARMSYDEVVFEALCFGWIDSKPRALDEMRSMLWLAPRKPRTGWSEINKQRVADAIAQGRMQPAGLAKVEAAKLDGSWAALDAVERLEVPEDLAAALKAPGPAHDHFAAFPRSVKRGILEWIASAKTAPTRRRRVQETAEKAARNERANQWPAATAKRAVR
jgi:uncharacterized protein YdeI (YjbR/CyaY-like superfamily)